MLSNPTGNKMKQLLFILTTAFFLSNALAQTTTDTLNYLKTFETNKAAYIGKPFSILQDSLKIQIKYFSPLAGFSNDKSKETSTAFYFIIPESIEDLSTQYIEVFWEPYLNSDMSHEIYRNAPDDAANWIPAAKAFYKNGIIKDIKVY